MWLIYKCEQCDTTWNMEILSRAKPTQIEKSLYQRFLKNDYDTAVLYAFNQQTLSKNKAVACFEDISYTIDKINIPENDDILEIETNFNLGLRLDKLLSDELNISRTKIKSLFEDGIILCEDTSITMKTKVKSNIKLKLKEILI